MKLEDLKGQKLMEPNFCLEKFLFLGKKPKISSATGIFYFCQEINLFMFLFFTQKWFMKVFFVILQKAYVLKKFCSKMLSANQIAVFFDQQYL